MLENWWLVFGAIVAILFLLGVGWLIRLLVKLTPEEDRKAIPIPTLLGVSALGAVALVCSAGITYGLSVGQTGSIETRQQELTSQGATNPEQTPVGSSVGTQGVVSSSQGLGILGTIGSAAVGGIAGVLVQRSTS